MAEEEPQKKNEPDKPKQDPIAAKTEIIPDERIDRIVEANEALQEKVASLEKKSQQTVVPGSVNTWDTVSDRDLEYVITHQAEYPDHAQAALSEIRKRDKSAITTQLSVDLGTQGFVSENKEAFDINTPMGKEVAKILKQNRAQPEVLSDVVELAKYRTGANKKGNEERKQVVDALKSADTHTPGADSLQAPSVPSFMDMPKEDFEDEAQKVRMKTFK